MRMITVLVAEDEKLIRSGIRHMIDQFFSSRPDIAYQVLEASSGRDAYRKCVACSVDILITDIKMPAMSGVALAKRLAGDGVGMHILAISGHQDYEYVRAMMKLGVHDYLIKPISSKQLFEAMEHFVAHVDAPGAPRAAAAGRAGAQQAVAPNLALSVAGERAHANRRPVAQQDVFYDLAAAPDAADAQPKDLLAAAAGAMLQCTGADQLETTIVCLFDAYQRQRTPQAEIQQGISWLQYELMGKSADYIEFISKSRFGRYDLSECAGGSGALSQLRSRVLETLLHLYGQMALRSERDGDKMLAEAKAFIEAHFASDLQLNHVADIVHLHPNYFSTLFRQREGVTFREYLRKLRIEAAKELILSTGLSIAQIAERVGYGDSAHLFRAFKSVTGITPSAFRRMARRP